MNLFENAIAFSPRQASEVGDWEDVAYYMRVPRGLGPSLIGGAKFWDNPAVWEGTPEEIDHAVQVVLEWIAQPGETLEELMTMCPWYGAQFRIGEGGALEARQGVNLPVPPWEFRLTAAPGGGAYLEFRSQEEGQP